MPSSGGIVLSIALGSVGSSLQNQHPAQETTCGAVPSTAWAMHCSVLHRLLLGQCRAGAALSDTVRLEHTVLLGVMGIVLHGNHRILKALLLSLAGLEEEKRYPQMNPLFLLPSETGGFEVRGDWSELGRWCGVAGWTGREIAKGLG